MAFLLNLVVSRMKREKARLFFILLAIASSSCLVVWTIGGFQALFIDETTKEANYLGDYDLRIASQSFDGPGGEGARGSGKFTGPTSRRYYESDQRSQGSAGSSEGRSQSASNGAETADVEGRRSREAGASVDGDKTEGAAEGGRSRADVSNGTASARRDRGRGQEVVLPEELVHSIRQDKSVSQCDEVFALRMYVYAPGTRKSILEDDDAVDEGARPTVKRALASDDEDASEAPEGVDPALHRKAFAAYRSTMGTPLGMASRFLATTATEAPFELSGGRWFNIDRVGGKIPREAVMTVGGAKKYNAKVGDPLILLNVSSLIGRAVECQLEVVGIVDDPCFDGFYVSSALGRELGEACDAPPTTNALFLKVRGAVDDFRDQWSEKLARTDARIEAVTRDELAARRLEAFKQSQTFNFQAVSGALLASLAALTIVFTALNTSIDAQRRLIAFYRVSGMTRAAVAFSILIEGAILAIPGWIAGMLAGWALVYFISGKPIGLNCQSVCFSFLCTVAGALFASLTPMIQSAKIKPLEAFGEHVSRVPYLQARRRQTRRVVIAALVGLALICADAALIRFSTIDTMKRAALHSGIGVFSLAIGVVLLVPLAIRVAELAVTPVLAFMTRLDSRVLRRELSGNSSRVVAVAIALSVGGGLFVTIQIWGYSMLKPFLLNRQTPEAFAAFLPVGLRPEAIDELKALPMVDEDRFISVAVEQAALSGLSDEIAASKGAFANVVFFGVDVEKAFEGKRPLIGMRFRQGVPEEAWQAMKSGRGVVVTDSLSIDYKLNLGDTLKVAHPREHGKVLEYPIVGVVAFDGWQWLSKTGGVRRNYGRSGGLVFARESMIADDYEVQRRSYFWFDQRGAERVDYGALEAACDKIARKSLRRDLADLGTDVPSAASQTAYVKLSTRESLTQSIMSRADNVIWGLSKTPLTTLAIAAIAVVGAVANSVRARRWQYGVMRALGTTRGAIVRMVVVEGVTIGVVASTTSFLFGFLAAQGALKLGRSMFGSQDPPLILPVEGLLIGLALTLALCVAAALYPAIRTGYAEPLKLLQSGRVSD